METLTITRPDDWHTHLRDGDALDLTCVDMARVMGRAIVMPNLVPPVTTVRLAAEYRQRILRAMQDAPRQFDPLMTLYLTDTTSDADVREAAATSWLAGVKLYPAGATTNSAAGVNSLEALYPVLHSLENQGFLTSYWQTSVEGPRRKYYRITAKGTKALAKEKQQWLDVHTALAQLWGPSPALGN